jgi:hypothetical protein
MSPRGGNPAKQSWDPITISDVNPVTPMARAFVATNGRKHHYRYRIPQPAVACKAFGNRLYDGVALTFEDGSMHLSFKRRDRSAIRDWRHFQAIKNEVAGPEREAVEIFPAESNLLDGANEYHLWVLPPGKASPLGLDGAAALGGQYDGMDHAGYRAGTSPPGARQRPWEPGIPTGLGRNIDE